LSPDGASRLQSSRIHSQASYPLTPVTTFTQYQRAVEVAMRERGGLRKGQTYFNVLLELEQEFAEPLAGSAVDPFYDDAKLPSFLLLVKQELG
jgi:hypothetical protein